MAFVVEDGTGKSDANSYASVAYADAYFADRGIALWVGTPQEKETYLIRATDYIDGRFASYFKGQQLYTSDPIQALQFPRDMFVGMPATLLKATCEYALRAIGSTLAPDPTYDPSGMQVASNKTKVGPIETEVSFAAGSGNVRETIRSYPAADMLIKPLLRGSSANGTVVRG